MPLKFGDSRLKKVEFAPHAIADGEVETIHIDAAPLPGGGLSAAAGEPPPAPLTPAQRRHRLALAAFRKSFSDFPVGEPRSRIAIDDLKRGDVLQIKTIVGKVFLRIIDRIGEHGSQAGEILCECHYELGDQSVAAHAATVTLPICSKDHLITGADGRQRQASRKLKMRSDTELPAQVGKVLDERFVVELLVYASPQAETLRAIDLWRFAARVAVKAARLVWRVLLWVKAWIAENNRREREKKAQKAEARRQKQAARDARRQRD